MASSGESLGERVPPVASSRELAVDQRPLISLDEEAGGFENAEAESTRRTLVVAHTSRVPHRVLLRRLLFLFKGSSLYFHPMADVIRSGEAAGLRLAREIRDRAFSILVFERP